MKRIRSGDTVVVIAGKSKGHIGKVARVSGDSVVVEGANFNKKHVKPNPQIDQKGGILSIEAPLNVSNVAIFNPVSRKADKVRFGFIEKDGNKTKVRYFKSDDELIDID